MAWRYCVRFFGVSASSKVYGHHSSSGNAAGKQNLHQQRLPAKKSHPIKRSQRAPEPRSLSIGLEAKIGRQAMLQPEVRVPLQHLVREEAKIQYGILFQDDLRTAVLTRVTQISGALSLTVTMHRVPLAETMEIESLSMTGTVVCVQARLQLQGAHVDIVTVVMVGRGTLGVTGGEIGVGMQNVGIEITWEAGTGSVGSIVTGKVETEAAISTTAVAVAMVLGMMRVTAEGAENRGGVDSMGISVGLVGGSMREDLGSGGL